LFAADSVLIEINILECHVVRVGYWSRVGHVVRVGYCFSCRSRSQSWVVSIVGHVVRVGYWSRSQRKQNICIIWLSLFSI